VYRIGEAAGAGGLAPVMLALARHSARADTAFPCHVVAWVRLRPGVEATEEEIRQFCQGQIAYYKIPEHIRFVTEFPATLSENTKI
jgi:acyl-coenzyme A synthetase/AMP-(fatty) acid ligase